MAPRNYRGTPNASPSPIVLCMVNNERYKWSSVSGTKVYPINAVFHCRIKNQIDIFESSTAPVLRSDETEASSVETHIYISCPHSTSCRVSDVDLPIYLDFFSGFHRCAVFRNPFFPFLIPLS